MKKSLLPLLLFLILLSGFGITLNAQSLYFCEGVDDQGYPKNSSEVFLINKEGGSLYFLVKLPYRVNCTYVNYELYSVDSEGRQEYNTTIKQVEVGESWTWFWKKVTFYEAGTYMVYVYDCNSRILTQAKIKIKYDY